jgi:hypothetical protein
MQAIQSAISNISDFGTWNHAKKIAFFAWFLHEETKIDFFSQRDIKKCYDDLHLAPPSNIGSFLESLVSQKKALKSTNGYKLTMQTRVDTAQLAGRPSTKEIGALLRSLPASIPSLTKRAFLNECLLCFQVKAYRASIIMAWCLAYDHLCDYILKKSLSAFNARWIISHPNQHKKGTKSINHRDDLARELKESEVIEIAKDANIVTGDQYKILKAKLDRRNSAAHPSSVDIEELQAEEFIDDLIKNIVMKLSL